MSFICLSLYWFHKRLFTPLCSIVPTRLFCDNPKEDTVIGARVIEIWKLYVSASQMRQNQSAPAGQAPISRGPHAILQHNAIIRASFR